MRYEDIILTAGASTLYTMLTIVDFDDGMGWDEAGGRAVRRCWHADFQMGFGWPAPVARRRS
jgi:hypothetical protein